LVAFQLRVERIYLQRYLLVCQPVASLSRLGVGLDLLALVLDVLFGCEPEFGCHRCCIGVLLLSELPAHRRYALINLCLLGLIVVHLLALALERRDLLIFIGLAAGAPLGKRALLSLIFAK